MEEVQESKKKSAKLLTLGLVAGTVMIVAVLYLAYGPRWYQGYAPTQPIPFSHRVHAGKFEIPCLYCHASAEHTAFAEVPGLETCMNCHSLVKLDSPWIQQVRTQYEAEKPIAWVKVHVLPDFVQFNHSRHIQAGLDCSVCHGPIHKMEKVYQWAPMNMGWCVDCHRSNDHLTPSRVQWGENTIAMQGLPSELDRLLGRPKAHNADLSCSTCHY